MPFLRSLVRVSDNLLSCKQCATFSKNCWNGELYFGSKIEIPSPPKRPLTAYMIFCKENRKNVLKENPSLSSPDQIKMLAEKWGLLTGEMKKPYEISARASTLQYSEEHKKFYENLTEEQKEKLVKLKAEKREARHISKLKKALRESGVPKPPGPAYALFVQAEAKNKWGINHAPDFIKKVAEMWKSLSEADKKIYRDHAQAEKLRYSKELAEWQQKMESEGKQDLIKAFAEVKGRGKIVEEDTSLSKKKEKASEKTHSEAKQKMSKN